MVYGLDVFGAFYVTSMGIWCSATDNVGIHRHNHHYKTLSNTIIVDVNIIAVVTY